MQEATSRPTQSIDQAQRRGPRLVDLRHVVLAVGLFATSPVLVRYAAPLSPFEITFGRMVVAALALAIFARGARVPLHFTRAEVGKFALYGLITALHFLLYIASLGYTSIAHSLSLVYTAPVFVTIFTAFFLRERISSRKWLGIPVTTSPLRKSRVASSWAC